MSLTDRPTPKPTKRLRETRILTIDIERLPGIAYAWQPRTDYIPPTQWIRWPSLLSFAAKWHGERTTEFHAAWDDPTGMLRRAWQLYNEADIVVTYNGVRFDNKHLKSEWLTAGMTLPATWKDVDLFAEVRRSLGFESKSLGQVCKRLGIPGKQGAYSIPEAEAAMNGDIAAQRRVEKYNRADVKATEAAYDRLRGWLPGHPIVGGVTSDQLACPQCGSENLTVDGWHTAVVLEYARYRCGNCGAQVRSNNSRRLSTVRGIR